MIGRRHFLLAVCSAVSLAAEETPDSLEQRVFQAINFQRVSADAEPLKWAEALRRTSRDHSRRMLLGGFFGHNDPLYGDLSARMAVAGIEGLRVGENVFREKDYPDPVSIAVVSWMYSEGHRRNLLTPEFVFTGVGAAIADDGTVALTQQFLTPPPPLSGTRSRSRM